MATGTHRVEAQSGQSSASLAGHPGRPAAGLPPPTRRRGVAALEMNDAQRSDMNAMRETFAYAGGTRDPFASLINMSKSGPEIGDLELVGIYMDLRSPTNNLVVLRERGSTAKRHKLRVGDQLGRARLVQIRNRDAVFMIQDFGFERQETLSLRKQEVVTP